MQVLIFLLAILAPTLSQEVKCPTGWIGNKITGSCFLLVKESLDWETARRKCESIGNGAVLATIYTSQDNKFVKEMLAKEASIVHGAWMGGTDYYNAGKWMWTDGTEVSCFTDWHKGEPSGTILGRTEDCLAWWNWENWEWNDESCKSEIQSVCMIPANKCGNGWTEDPVSRKCYKILDEKNDWETAKKSCASLNSELASIRTYQEYKFVRDFLNPSDEQNFWLGGNVAKDGSWVWSSNGSPISLATYSKWSTGQPTFSRNENCLKLRRSNMEWFSANCGRKLSAVCKRYPTDSLTNSSRVTCKEGWIQSPTTGACFKVLKQIGDRTTFDNATSKCKAVGADLASISSSEEWDVVEKYLRESGVFGTWLGGGVTVKGNTFSWRDGTPVTFTNWSPGRPYGSGTHPFCAVALGMTGWNWKWIDMACPSSIYPLCKIKG